MVERDHAQPLNGSLQYHNISSVRIDADITLDSELFLKEVIVQSPDDENFFTEIDQSSSSSSTTLVDDKIDADSEISSTIFSDHNDGSRTVFFDRVRLALKRNHVRNQSTCFPEGTIRFSPYKPSPASGVAECSNLRTLLAKAILRKKYDREMIKHRSHLSGVGMIVQIISNITSFSEENGESCFVDMNDRFAYERNWSYHPEIVRTLEAVETTTFPIRLQDGVLLSELPPPPSHPTDPDEIRKLIRSKMVRCKKCRSRFIEKNVYERHLRDKHYIDYIAYLIQQEEEIAEQRLAELEANRIEEIASGGYIPPESEIFAEGFDVEVDKIPLPGELSRGVPARFDKDGFLRQPKRSYKKKVSPQCLFCDKRFRNEISLKKHFVKKHPEAVDFVQCLRCFKAVKSKQSLDTHDCDLTFLCFECIPLRNLCTQQRLLNHRAKFHRGTNSGFKCNMCNLKFLTPRKLRKHKKMSHVFTKTYPCHFCDEIFTSECSVTTHERIHTGIIKFECKICDFKCNRFIWMEDHQKEEHGYICSVCQHRCAEWSSLKDHTLLEHGGYLTSESNAGYIDSPRVWVMFKGE